MGAGVQLCGVVGRDEAGDRLVSLCAACGIGTTALGQIQGRQTSRKVRVLARQQQLVRLDWETDEAVDLAVVEALFAKLPGRAPARRHRAQRLRQGTADTSLPPRSYRIRPRCWRPVLVDPRASDFARYRGATVIKPNLAEVERATGRQLAEGDVQGLDDAARETAKTK